MTSTTSNATTDSSPILPGARDLLPLVGVLVAFIALALTWRWTPLRELLGPEQLEAWLGGVAQRWWAPVAVVGAFVVGGLTLIPLTLLIVHSGLLLGPWTGLACALCGALASGVVTFYLGRWLGRDATGRVLGERMAPVTRVLRRRGLGAMILVRIVPVAPYTVVNLVAGAADVRPRDFIAGTLLGLLQGTVALTLFGDRLGAVFRDASWTSMVALATIAVLLIAGAWFARRRLSGEPASGGETP